jgi:hypothetical protein
MSAPILDHFGRPPANVGASQRVRRWDTGLLAAGAAFTGTLLAVGWVMWHPLPGSPVVPPGGLLSQLAGYPHLLLSSFSSSSSAIATWADNPAAGIVSRAALHVRLLPAWIAGVIAGGWALKAGLVPRSNTAHVSGPRLLEGMEAEQAALRIAAGEREGAKTGFVSLHPLLDLPKRRWTRHVLVYGGVGSGKTQILLPVMKAITDKRGCKAFCVDTKGDYTSRFPTGAILSPWDARSHYWDIAADVRTSSQASAFAASIIPGENGANQFFATAATLILTGVLRALQQSRGVDWTWADLDELLTYSSEELAPVLEAHFKKAHPLVSGTGTSTESVMATLSAFTQTISQLAEAFGDGTRADGTPRKRLSLVEWAKDDYGGRRVIIAQAGPDPGLTQRYLAAAINILVPEIISPSLPDDVAEDGRSIFFMLDELAAIGRIQLGPLVDKGRSKGVSVVMGIQDQAQIAALYGQHFATALSGMVGTHIVCSMAMGDTRKHVAEMIGSARFAITQADAAGAGSTHEEMRAIVQPSDLTSKLGRQVGKRFKPNGFAIRALANLGTDELLVLDWPGVILPQGRRAFVPAAWTLPGYVKPQELALEDASAAEGLAGDVVAGVTRALEGPALELPAPALEAMDAPPVVDELAVIKARLRGPVRLDV